MIYFGKFNGTNFAEFKFPDLATFQRAKAAAVISNAAELKANPLSTSLALTMLYDPITHNNEPKKNKRNVND